MILGIDAHCIRGTGGSITHLREVLRVAEPVAAGFSKVILWSGRSTLERIEDRPWLEKVFEAPLDRDLLRRSHWSASKVSKRARAAGCDVLWVPGCSFAGSFRPYVAMSRNMLPFEWREMRRYGVSPSFWKFLTLRITQAHTYRHSSGMIYLSEYARAKVAGVVGKSEGDSRIIPHGIEGRFAPKPPRQLEQAQGNARDFQLLYVSAVDLYKHQWHVIEAVELLQREGFAVKLDLVGPVFPVADNKLREALDRFRGATGSVRYVGAVKHSELHQYYQSSDIFVYASSCENLPNILLEAMASGLPIASSSRGPMPEVLKDAAVYFDPERPREIAAALRKLLESPSLREEKSALGLQYSKQYSWERCASESLSYLAAVAARYHTSPSSSSN